MRSEVEQHQWEMQCYGMSQSALEQDIKHSFGPNLMLAMSILSDAQYLISPEMNDFGSAERAEQARQFINKAKYIISQEMKAELEG